jgi:dTDP-4-amino-4,6-dideoxy-D-galactose acyltransferase
MNYEILEWDSAFFGFSTARISPARLDKASLEEILTDMKAIGVRLAYWATGEEAPFDVKNMGGSLTDKKVTFSIDLKNLKSDHFISTDLVHPATSDTPEEDLSNLAVQAGAYSRFARDPQFPHDKFTALYKEWMRKSLAGELADDVLIIQTDDQTAGMVTVADKNGCGDIGLIAVNENQRGRHYGEILVRAAQLWYLDHSLEKAQVVTQLDNTAACGLYRKCGYSISRTDFVYHFWLPASGHPL